MTDFSDDELDRYARHLVLPDIGGRGQAALKACAGCGCRRRRAGLPCLLYLAAAGVGQITVIDDDAVAISNLQRQILFATADAGRGKAAVAVVRLAALNPHVDGRRRWRYGSIPATRCDLLAGHDRDGRWLRQFRNAAGGGRRGAGAGACRWYQAQSGRSMARSRPSRAISPICPAIAASSAMRMIARCAKLCRSRGARRADRGDRIADGARGAARDHRVRRESGRAVAALRCDGRRGCARCGWPKDPGCACGAGGERNLRAERATRPCNRRNCPLSAAVVARSPSRKSKPRRRHRRLFRVPRQGGGHPRGRRRAGADGRGRHHLFVAARFRRDDAVAQWPIGRDQGQRRHACSPRWGRAMANGCPMRASPRR